MDENRSSQNRRGGRRDRGNTAGRGRGRGRGATGHRGRGGHGGQSYQGGRGNSSHRQRGHGEQGGQRGGSRRRGQEGAQGEQRLIVIGFKQLHEALEKEPEEIAMDFGSQRCLPAFHNLVEMKEMKQEMVALLLKVLAKLCECRSKEYLFEILSALNDSMFLLKHVKAYLCRMGLGSATSEEFSEVIADATTVFHTLLRKIPQSSDSLPIVDLLASVKKLKDIEFQFDSELLDKIEQLTSIQEESYAEVKKQEKLHSSSHSRIATDSSGPPPNNFREISVVPRHDDIHSDDPVYLRRNKVDGAYDNLEHYLDVQFRLLREDFVMPLRDGIKELVAMKGRKDAATKRLSDIRVYYDVRVLYPECTGQGLVYRLKFDNARLQRYRWENGKRLIFGSLLCLSKDRFQTFLFATVVNRELKDLVKGIVTVKFVEAAHEIMAIQQDDVYEMVETTAYFEAYRHVLTALQETHREDLPFEPYFVECRQDVLAPRYLRRPGHDEAAVTFDFSPIVRQTSMEEVQQESLLKRLTKMRIRAVDATHVPVLDTYSWPSAKDMGLDDSQRDSLKIALTKELAIIQGPPGTGKTYMGLKIAKLLLHNKDIWLKDIEDGVLEDGKPQKKTKPILVICYTNHALDQFLEGIQQFHPEGIVRIGGRSSSEALKSMNLSSVKQQMQRERRMPRHIHRGFSEMRSDLEDITRRMTISTTALKKCRENILTEKTLKNFGLITNEQYKSLTKPYRKKIIQGCVIVEWLMLTSVDLNEPVHHTETAEETVELLGNIPVTFDGRKEVGHTAPGIDFGGKDFSLVANVMTGIGGTIVSKVRPQGGWEKNCKSLFINLDGFVTFSVGEVGMIQSRTKVNDGQHHEVALVYVAEEGRLLLYIDRDLEDNSILPLMPDYEGDVVKVGFTCDGYPPGQSYLSGIIASLTYHRNSVYRDQIFGEDGGANVENEAATIQDQRIVDGENDEMLEEIGTQLQGVNADTFIDVVDPTKEHVVKQDSGWMVQDPKKMKKRIEITLKRELISTAVMSDEEAKRAKDLWKLSLVDRWRLYRKWTREIMGTHENAVETIQEEYEQGVRKLQEVRNQQSVEVLRDSQVIGMTTTGAAKYREVLQQVRPRITIVEEAAEVLESHIVTALTPACEHLILIGDHKQLRPNPTVYDLAKSYNLDVSLFERLVVNDLPYACLHAQHRMRPEISQMMKHIYPDLEDHDSVNHFENIRGVSKNIFFIQHYVPEASVEDIKSHSNDHEAKFIISLCRYFLQQNYKASQITILTPYVGQLLAFKKHMIPPNTFKGVRVCTVDNYQGEENDIILMSLVRSNDKHKIGFLSTDNRICVALSRAREGFFCIGNIALFEAQNDLWKKIIGQMRALGNVGQTLSLSCQNHPQAKIDASRKEDFAKAPNGGCMMPCEFRLKCGHVCEQLCHPKDSAHEEYKCRKPCEKNLCEFGHKCKKVCYKDCGVCRELVKKVIPSCGHEQLVPCYLDPDEFSCLEPCEKRLACDHVCDQKCGEACAKECGTPVEKEWSSCGHRCITKCHIDPTISPCKYPCLEMLLCGHECSGTCSGCKQGRFHEPCQANCGRVLFCDHNCNEPCTSSCPPCAQKCENRCIHSACKKKCNKPCPPCQEPCKWRCSHYQCTKKCGEQCDRERCNEPCRKQIKKCKHPCIGLCGEPCPKKCRICDKNEVTEIMFGTEDEDDARFVELSDCSHVFEVTGMDMFMDLEWEKRVKGEISNIKMVKCPRCCVVIRTSLRYGNIVKNVLRDFETIKMKVAQLDVEAKLKIQDTLEEVQELRKIFPKEAKKIDDVLRSDYVSSNALNLVQNQTRFLKFLVKLKEIVEQLRKDIVEYPRTKVNTSVTVNELDGEIGVWKDWVCKTRQRFGDQVLVDCKEELLRSFLLFTHKSLETQLANREVDLDETERKALKRVENVLERGEKLDPSRRERYMKFLEDISERHCDDVRYVPVSLTEKNMIVKAMDLKQGHWFKCPKGHIYCIDQCGGATEEGSCPECGNAIGGTHHRLRDDNQLAGEMDGARHAAWSQTTNNMANFDLQ